MAEIDGGGRPRVSGFGGVGQGAARVSDKGSPGCGGGFIGRWGAPGQVGLAREAGPRRNRWRRGESASDTARGGG
jgi:hypothetical protein